MSNACSHDVTFAGARDRCRSVVPHAETAHDDGCRCAKCCNSKFDDLALARTRNYNSEYLQNPAPLVAGEIVEVAPAKSDPDRRFTRGRSYMVGESVAVDGRAMNVVASGTSNIVIHNHYNPSTMLAAIDSRAGDKIVMNVIRDRHARLEIRSKLSDRDAAELVLMEHRRSGFRMECDCCHVKLHIDCAVFMADYPGITVGVKSCNQEPCKEFAHRVLRGADEMRAESSSTTVDGDGAPSQLTDALNDEKLHEYMRTVVRRRGRRTTGPRQCDLCQVSLHTVYGVMHGVEFPGESMELVTCTREPCLAWARRVQSGAPKCAKADASIGARVHEASRLAPTGDIIVDGFGDVVADGRICSACGKIDLPAEGAWLHAGLGRPGFPHTFVTCATSECMTWAGIDGPPLNCGPDFKAKWDARTLELARRHLESDTSSMPIGKAPVPDSGRVDNKRPHGSIPECERCHVMLTPERRVTHAARFSRGSSTFLTCGDSVCTDWAVRKQLGAAADLLEERRCAVLNVARDQLVVKSPTPEQMPSVLAQLDEIRRAPSRPFQELVDYVPRSDGFDQRRVDEIKASLLTVSTKAVKK